MFRMIVVGAVIAMAAAGAVAAEAQNLELDDGVVLHTGSWKNPVVRRAFTEAAALNPDLFFSEISILPKNAQDWANSPLILAGGVVPTVVGPFHGPWKPATGDAAGSSSGTFQLAAVTGDVHAGSSDRNPTNEWSLGYGAATASEDEELLALQIELEDRTGGLDFALTHAEVVTAAVFAILGLAVLAVGWGFLAAKLNL